MTNYKFRLPLVAGLLLLLVAGLAQAQATRTWVSGVGDDANPCSRTAPCKTFAGAISKTAAGGEISVLDPGGYGALNITKSITLNGEGTIASILNSGTNGIIINGAGVEVILRNISINGGTATSPGVNGIRFIQGKSLELDRVQIYGQSKCGVLVETSLANTGKVYMTNTSISKPIFNGANPSSNDTAGVCVKPGASTTATVQMDRVQILGNHIGVRLYNGARVSMRNSVVSDSAQFGLWAFDDPASPASAVKLEAFVVDSQFTNNVTNGVRSQGSDATVRLSGNLVTGSSVGINSLSSGGVLSYSNNPIAGNTNDANAAPTGFSTEL